MIRSVFWVAVGVAAALEVDKLLDEVRDRLKPSNVTTSVLDKINATLEAKQTSTAR